MKIQTYANRITKGSMELDSKHLYKAFPCADSDFVDYILDKIMLDGDNRITSECDSGIVDYNKITFKASSTLFEGDTFNEEVGQLIVRLKLHKKAQLFMLKVHKEMTKEVKSMQHTLLFKQRIDGMDEIRKRILDYPGLKFSDDFITYGITDNVSFATLTLKEDDVDDIFDERPVTLRHIEEQLYDAMCKGLTHKYCHSSYGIRKLIWNCIAEEMDKCGQVKLKAIVRRNKDDEHDEVIARRELCNKLQKQYENFCRRMAEKVCVKVLAKQLCNFRACSAKCSKKHAKMREKVLQLVPGFPQDKLDGITLCK